MGAAERDSQNHGRQLGHYPGTIPSKANDHAGLSVPRSFEERDEVASARDGQLEETILRLH